VRWWMVPETLMAPDPIGVRDAGARKLERRFSSHIARTAAGSSPGPSGSRARASRDSSGIRRHSSRPRSRRSRWCNSSFCRPGRIGPGRGTCPPGTASTVRRRSTESAGCPRTRCRSRHNARHRSSGRCSRSHSRCNRGCHKIVGSRRNLLCCLWCRHTCRRWGRYCSRCTLPTGIPSTGSR
jgi:hypothetical protein